MADERDPEPKQPKKPKRPKTEADAAAEVISEATLAEAYLDYEAYTQRRASEVWSYEDTGHNLNLDEQLFVRSYIIDRNPVAAMRRLGHYSDNTTNLKARATKYLAKTEVSLAVEFLAKRLMDKLEITAERVQRQIASVAFFDPREVSSFDEFGVKVLNSRFWSAEQAAAIQSIETGPNGLKVKFYDRLRATEMLSKQLGLQKEENDPAEAARIGADAVINKIMTIFDRVVPDKRKAEPVALPPPEKTAT